MYKKIFTIITLSFAVLMNIVVINATNSDCPFYPEIDSFIELEKGPIIKLNKINNETFWQFKDSETAFSSINSHCNDLISSIQKKYNVSRLSNQNWEDYSIYIDEINFDDYEECSKLKVFLDVCDNVDRNSKAVLLANNKTFDEGEMAQLLPYFSPFSSEYYSRDRITPRAAFNVTAAVNYATKWSTSYNQYEYRWWPSNDCTNFVSQVAKAGGASKNDSYSRTDYRSWYYKNHNDDGFTISWIRADYFVRHWGVKYSTTSYVNFANNITKGSFIAMDYQKDGKYDHCGFVTQADASVGNYSNGKYKDFKVAQHTSNYMDWASRGASGWINSNALKVILNTPY